MTGKKKSLHEKRVFHQTSIKNWLFRVPGANCRSQKASAGKVCKLELSDVGFYLATLVSPGKTIPYKIPRYVRWRGPHPNHRNETHRSWWGSVGWDAEGAGWGLRIPEEWQAGKSPGSFGKLHLHSWWIFHYLISLVPDIHLASIR